MRKLLPFLLLAIIACQEPAPYPGFKTNKEGIYYQLHRLGDEQQVEPHEYLYSRLLITAMNNDTLFYAAEFPYLIPPDSGRVRKSMEQFHLGDSVTLLVRQTELLPLLGAEEDGDTTLLQLNFVLDAAYPLDELEIANRRMISEREIEEQQKLHHYLQKQTAKVDTIAEVYRILIERDSITQPSVQWGKEISIHYSGSFMDGYVFDDSRAKGNPLSFRYGIKDQVLEGISMGIGGLQQGDKVKIIIPSRRAFGERGSIAGIVPPYTTLIYTVDIVNISD